MHEKDIQGEPTPKVTFGITDDLATLNLSTGSLEELGVIDPCRACCLAGEAAEAIIHFVRELRP
jgi:hypothetical protein